MLLDQVRKALSDTKRPMKEVAEAAEIHPVTLSRFKSGGRAFPVETMEKVLDAIGCEAVVRRKKSKKKA